jgi:hypothetical protein
MMLWHPLYTGAGTATGGTDFPISPGLAVLVLTGHGPSLGFTIHMPDEL